MNGNKRERGSLRVGKYKRMVSHKEIEETTAHTVVTATEWVGDRLVKEGSWDLGTFAPRNYCFF